MDCLKLAVIVLLEPCRVTVVVELPGFSIVTSPPIIVQPVNSYSLFILLLLYPASGTVIFIIGITVYLVTEFVIQEYE